MGDGVFEEHCAESGERRATILWIIGGDNACAVAGRVREEHLVDVAIVQEECELVIQLETIVETATDCEETTGWFEIFDASFDAWR